MDVDEKQIYNLIAKDSEEGLYQLIKLYKNYVWNIINKILQGRQQDIEECMSDVFFTFWQKRHSINLESGNVKGLLACIARNTAINRYNKLKRQQCISYECENLIADDAIEMLIDSICQDEIVNLILKDLCEKDRNIFVKRHIFMESIGEIAEDMNLDERQVRNSLYQSKKKLKKTLVRRNKHENKFFSYNWRM